MNIGLIACSKTKLGKDMPEKKFKAQDIYQGNTFKKSKSEGIKLYNCDDWFILSGNKDYNLLDIISLRFRHGGEKTTNLC